MITSYSQQLESWRDFYTLTGTTAATLMGLLFVAMSLNPRIMADDGPRHLQAWAGQTMSNLIALLVLSLVCMLPDLNHPAFALSLIVIGGQGLLRGILRLRGATSQPDKSWQLRHLLLRLVLPVGAYLVMLYVGISVLIGNNGSIDLLVWAVFLLVSAGAGAAWALLAQLGNRTSGSG
jgi:hypothetical protein